MEAIALDDIDLFSHQNWHSSVVCNLDDDDQIGSAV